ncbi:sortase [Patescibacteria group bacterium]|nr:sortase [Patescibacteria group bacterium]
MKKMVLWKTASLVSLILGFFLLASVVVPIISYESASREKYPDLLSPIVANKPVPKLESFDYTRASNWFIDDLPTEEFISSNISYYTFSIPKLGIENARVNIGGEDLSKSLIQYPGTARPGKEGNTVVFGHSILPQFFNPKNYIAIFSTLPDLEKGDAINIEYDGISYTYIVQDMFEVLPTDLYVLDQGQNDSYLSVITCVPPGHPLKPRRLVVRARIVPFEASRLSQQINADIRN